MRILQALFFVSFFVGQASAATVYVSRFWHNHQPIYWPEWNGNGSQNSRVQFAWDSIALKSGQTYGTTAGHPDNNLTDIFGLDDRRNAYQGRPRDSLSGLDSSAGFALSYSGSLIDNVRNLGANGQLGYGGGWWDGNRQAKNWLTPGGGRRLDLVGFNYHHSLGPLIPKGVFRKELQIFRQAWYKAWGGNSNLSDHSRGYFPTEMAFSTSMIDVLTEPDQNFAGYQWAIVASHHLSRTCPTYFNQFSLPNSYGIFSSPPNKADLLGPSPDSGWWYGQPNPGNAAWNVAPFAYQLHKARYVNPESGAAKELILVPSDDVLSYRFGYANEGISKIQSYIAPYATDPNRPVMVMPSSDGDNAWGGGYSSWMEATPQFFNDANNAGYARSAAQDFVNWHGGAADTVHIEDGAWIFPESDYGSPYFLKWIEPPIKAGSPTAYPGTIVDLEAPGFALKFWSWAPVITGANWVETAEQVSRDEGGAVDAWKIQDPYNNLAGGTWSSPNEVELAWHIYLAGLDSGFNYYGGLGNDDEVKQALATTRAIETLQPWFTTARRNNDRTPPSVLKPQRFPWNPGGYTFGWFNSIPGGDNRYLKKMPSEFYVWTHAYDLSGVQSVHLKVRVDADGTNAMWNDQNETYAGGSDVGGWIALPMTGKALPNNRTDLNAAAANGQIDYFITPPELADYYFKKITDTDVSGFRGKLLDYYIEATDAKGNVHKSEILHVFVEDDGATPTLPGKPGGVSATAHSERQITVSWGAVSGATSYLIKRGGTQIGTATTNAYAHAGLTPATNYTYVVSATNSIGTSPDSDPATARTLDAPLDFAMDGLADHPAYLLSSSGMTVYAAVRGSQLYVATWSTGNSGGANDHFILVSDALLASASAPAPWGKAGTVAVAASKPYLAAESINNYAGWFNAPTSAEVAEYGTTDGQLEGVIDLAEAFGAPPATIYVASVAYQTADGGIRGAQAPSGNGDDNIDPGEFLRIEIPAVADGNADGTFDRLDPAVDFTSHIESGSGGAMSITWAAVPGRTYQVQYCDALGGTWFDLGAPVAAGVGQLYLNVNDATASLVGTRFYRVVIAAQ